jgi:hypothetical protein
MLVVLLFSLNMPLVPVTADNNSQAMVEKVADLSLSLEDFSLQVKNGNSSQTVGVYANDHFAYPIVQQPSGNAGYVSSTSGVVTQFSMASSYGSIGLIAHNHLAGAKFSLLQVGDIITLVYGDGSARTFKVTQIKQYQALSPTSPYSNFVDLYDSSTTLSATTLFMNIYASSGRLVLQTCIARDGQSSWGRLFVVAESM